MYKFLFIIFNIISAFIIATQFDEYQHQLMFQFKGLLVLCFINLTLVACTFAIMFHEWLEMD